MTGAETFGRDWWGDWRHGFPGWMAEARRRHGGQGRGRGHRHAWGGGRGGFPPPFWFGPGPFGRGPRAKRGDVRAAALLLLSEQPLNGYQIMQEIEERSGGAWRPSPGSVYPALAQLEDEGLVLAKETEGRRLFELTDAGREYVKEHEDEVAAPWEAFTESVDDGVWGLLGEMKAVGVAAFQLTQAGTPEQVARAQEILAEAKRSLYGILADDEPSEGDV